MRGATTLRYAVDLTQDEHDKLATLARMLGTTRSQVIKRALDILLLPKRERGQRLCVCEDDRKVSDIAGV